MKKMDKMVNSLMMEDEDEDDMMMSNTKPSKIKKSSKMSNSLMMDDEDEDDMIMPDMKASKMKSSKMKVSKIKKAPKIKTKVAIIIPPPIIESNVSPMGTMKRPKTVGFKTPPKRRRG